MSLFRYCYYYYYDITHGASGDVDAQVGRGGERRPVVLLRLEDDDVELGAEEEDERDDGAERDADAQRDRLRLAPAEVDRHERHPDHARRVPARTVKNTCDITSRS